MNNLTKIVYTVESGSIQPELQSHEEYIITPGGVTLKRNGKLENSLVHTRELTLVDDPGVVAALFELVQKLDCGEFIRVESPEPPDGAVTESVKIKYGNGKICGLYFDPGTTYRGADKMMELIRGVTQNALPIFP